jgi:DNA-binding MarR family transcriptional regulator
MPTNATAPRGPNVTQTHGILYLLKQVQYKAFVRLERALQPLGITAVQFRIMSTLGFQAKLSSAQLARLYDVKPQTMIKQITLLEAKGLISRGVGGNNKRVLEVELTDLGRDLLTKSDRAGVELEEELLKPFTPGERAMYREFLLKMNRSLDGTKAGARVSADSPTEGTRPGVQRP